jgi:SAP domain-containing ribonucleoprotein
VRLSLHITIKMPEYTKMKNADLEALLKERNLPHTGKKAEMVARLEEDDKKKNNEDEIDWDDDTADASAVPAAPAPVETAAPTAEETETAVEGNNPQAVPNQEAAIDPSTTSDLSVKQPEEGGEASNGAATEEAKEPEAPKIDYTSGIAATDIDKELEARRKRMERFNIKADDQDEAAVEAQKRLERQKKFGDDGPDTNKLDSALSEKRQKRGREGGDDRGDFKRGRGRGRFRGGGQRGGERRDGGGERRNGGGERRGPREERAGGGGGGGWMSQADRDAAEKRKARFN